MFQKKVQVNTDPLHKIESGTEIGHSLEFDFVVPTSAQLCRAVKDDEIKRSRAHSTTASCSTLQNKKRLGLLSQPHFPKNSINLNLKIYDEK